MILADQSVFRSALYDDRRGVLPLITELMGRAELTAPPPVFTMLLQEFEARHHLDKIREWAIKVAPLEVNTHAWLAAGDLGGHLADLELEIEMVDLLMISLAIREGIQLWTFNKLYDQISERCPVTLYQPLGI